MPQRVIPACRICDSTESELVRDQLVDAPGSAIYRCKHCTMVYVFPIMTEEEEGNFYRAEFEKYMAGRSNAAWTSPSAHFDSFQTEGERRLQLVRPYLHTDDALLEIGSSTGYFLDDLRGYVRNVTGVEPNDAQRAFAISRGIKTVAKLEELDARTFDVIAMYYVLEHLRDPVGYLAALQPRLNARGRLLIEVPNVEDVLLSRYDIPSFRTFYFQKAHYHNFSSKTLVDVLTRAGYTAQVFPEQRYDISNHIHWLAKGQPGGKGKYTDILDDRLNQEYARCLKEHWLCDTVFAVASKP